MSRLILSGKMLHLLEDAKLKTTHVQAAVAYATMHEPMFSWCLEKNIPLKFWGRFDGDMPVKLDVLEWFYRQKNLSIECKLVRLHHAKVIWWHGFGVYIGSANFTSMAWFNNFEAGVFLSEQDLDDQSMRQDLTEFFFQMNEKSSSLTDELMVEFRLRAKELGDEYERQSKYKKKLSNNKGIKGNDEFSFVTKQSPKSKSLKRFIDEWKGTLIILQKLSNQLVEKKHLPHWINENISKGAIVDQFLHAHYAENVVEGNKSFFEQQFNNNFLRSEAAKNEAMIWWKIHYKPNENRVTLNEIAKKLEGLLDKNYIRRMTEEDVVYLATNIHSMRGHARQIPAEEQGLDETQEHTIDVKAKIFGTQLFKNTNKKGQTIQEFLYSALYDGSENDVAERIWTHANDPNYKFKRVGINMLGEIVGWAMPSKFPPRNGRTSKALRSLGFDVTIY